MKSANCILIKNIHIVNENEIKIGDVLIENGLISKIGIGIGIEAPCNKTVDGKWEISFSWNYRWAGTL